MRIELGDFFEGYEVNTGATVLRAAQLWKHLGCPYERALALFEGTEGDKKVAIEIVHTLGADAVYEKMKFEMRSFGIKNIPLGLRKSTLSNPANLTSRELEVLQLLKEGLQNREIGSRLFISVKTVSHHIASIFFKLDVNSRGKAVQQAIHLNIIK
jgi:DNA-binding NarL/FixJ family response regulator